MMSIFITSLILILIGFAMFYPLLFRKVYTSVQNDEEVRGFLQLNYILHLLAGCVAVLLFWVYSINYPLQISGIVYLLVIIVVALYYWKSPIPKWNLFYASAVFGFIVFYRSINEIVEITPLWPGILTGTLAVGTICIITLIIVALLFKPLRENITKSLTNSLFKYLFTFIGIRIVWGFMVLFIISVETRSGELMSALLFFLQVDLIKMILLLIFGFTVPIVLFFLLRKQLDGYRPKVIIRNYLVLFISILFAEFLYKYFLLQYGIVL